MHNTQSHNLKDIDLWPYPLNEYVLRFFWIIVKKSLWKLLWHRIVWLRMLILRVYGANVSLDAMAFSSTDIFRPWDLTLGKFVSIGPNVTIYNLKSVFIDDNTILSQNVYLCGGTHDYTKATLPLVRKDIVIGKNVWICAGAFIGPGVTIGDGAIIGARSVVTKDVLPWTVVAGNPAKFIKNRVIVD